MMLPDTFGVVLLKIVVLVFSVVFHEVSHGWVAERCGDPTARFLGRLTLNPVPHLDLWGSILLPGMLALMHSPFLFGYAKPVPVDPRNFRNPRFDGIKVALVGPFSNIFLALVCAVLLGLAAPFIGTGNAIATLLQLGVVINCLLAVFNLLPIPPLDGSWLLDHLLRGAAYNAYRAFKPYGMIVLIGVLLFPPVSNLLIQTPLIYLSDAMFHLSELIAGKIS
jgi:Zn-dependent protease